MNRIVAAIPGPARGDENTVRLSLLTLSCSTSARVGFLAVPFIILFFYYRRLDLQVPDFLILGVEMLFRWTLLLSAAALLAGCQTLRLAKNVKLIGFEDDVQAGKGVGPLRGEDCQWIVFGYPLSGEVKLDRAFQAARSASNAKGDVRYINNVKTEWDGFNAANIVAKNCLVVKAVGYR